MTRTGRPCSICSLPDVTRHEINLLLVEPGKSFRAIARQFNVSRDALRRHTNHLSPSTTRAREVKVQAEALTIADKLASLEKETREILAEARGAIGKDNRLALQALARLERQYEIRARIEGELPGPQVNVFMSPEWVQVQAVILTALEPLGPEARARVALALKKVAPMEGSSP